MNTNDNKPIIESKVIDNFLIVKVKTLNKIQITITDMNNQYFLIIDIGGNINV